VSTQVDTLSGGEFIRWLGRNRVLDVVFSNLQPLLSERVTMNRVVSLLLGATGFDVEHESMGRRSSWADSLNSSKHLTANTYQEPLALAA